MTAPEPSVEDLLGELVAVLAGAYRDADKRRHAAGHRQAPVTRLAGDGRMRSLAVRLARCGAARDYAGLGRLLDKTMLARPRTEREWRQLVILLAAAADPERITASSSTASTLTPASAPDAA